MHARRTYAGVWRWSWWCFTVLRVHNAKCATGKIIVVASFCVVVVFTRSRRVVCSSCLLWWYVAVYGLAVVCARIFNRVHAAMPYESCVCVYIKMQCTHELQCRGKHGWMAEPAELCGVGWLYTLAHTTYSRRQHCVLWRGYFVWCACACVYVRVLCNG